jgi:hypothetical protein
VIHVCWQDWECGKKGLLARDSLTSEKKDKLFIIIAFNSDFLKE